MALVAAFRITEKREETGRRGRGESTPVTSWWRGKAAISLSR
jgi:hypothetical protein